MENIHRKKTTQKYVDVCATNEKEHLGYGVPPVLRLHTTHVTVTNSGHALIFFYPSQYLLFRLIAHVRVNGQRVAGRREKRSVVEARSTIVFVLQPLRARTVKSGSFTNW